MAVRQSDYLTRFIKTNEIKSSNLIELVSNLDIGLFGMIEFIPRCILCL